MHGQAKASRAVLALGAIIERTPLPVRAISVDSGAEFMAGFADV